MCASSWRVVSDASDTGFDELRDLCIQTGDQLSLALGLAGQVTTVHLRGDIGKAVRLGTELVELLESIGDPALDVGLLLPAINISWTTGRVVDAMRLAQRVIDLAEGDSTMGNLMLPSPLAQALGVRALAGCFLGRPDWKLDFRRAEEVDRPFDPTRALTSLYKSAVVAAGALKPDAATLRHSAEILRMAEQSSDEIALALARQAHGTFLVYSDYLDDSAREEGLELLATIRHAAQQQRYSAEAILIVDILAARESARIGDTDRAIELARKVVDAHFESGEMFLRGSVTSILAEALLDRCADGDLQEAEAAIERLAAVPVEPGFVPHELPLLRLRALLARARGDDGGYRNRYRLMANDVG